MKPEKNILQKDVARKKRQKMLVINSLAVAGALVLFTLLGFVHRKQKNTVCWKLEIQLEGNNTSSYLDEKLITKLANDATDGIVGKELNEINIEAVHNSIALNSMVKEAHVFTTIDGRCVINIQQRKPIARIFNADGHSFYLDKEGFTMALSNHHTAKVPIFVGNIHEKLDASSFKEHIDDLEYMNKSKLDDIYAITTFISANEFWKSQVEHIHVNNDGDFEIIPRVGNHKINIGSAQNLEEKFKKLMAFYANTVHSKDLNQYSSMHIEYDGQVVCVRR